jgi:NlpC/P60 family putative phage cell wall peptidase
MRLQIIEETRSWLLTPYRHQASVKGEGADCLGLVRGVWREVIGPEPMPLPRYGPDWGERDASEPLLCALQAHFCERSIAARAPGDVLAFRMRASACVKHVAILCAPDLMIHAYWGRAVIAAPLTSWWRARLSQVFAFPGADEWRS